MSFGPKILGSFLFTSKGTRNLSQNHLHKSYYQFLTVLQERFCYWFKCVLCGICLLTTYMSVHFYNLTGSCEGKLTWFLSLFFPENRYTPLVPLGFQQRAGTCTQTCELKVLLLSLVYIAIRSSWAHKKSMGKVCYITKSVRPVQNRHSVH